MSDVQVVYSGGIEAYHENDVQTWKRIAGTIERLSRGDVPAELLASGRMATRAELEAVHHPAFVNYVKAISDIGGGFIGLDEEATVTAGGYDLAAKAAGASLDAVDSVLGDASDSSFALSVPPGHHSGPTYGGGLCIFNNVAIAAKAARRSGKVKKILLLDWDAHFGNGAYEIFRNDPEFYGISLHEYPIEELHIPATAEKGTFLDRGFLGFSFPAETGDREYGMVLRELLDAACKRFKPELIMVSAGQDGHFADHMSTMGLTSKTYGEAAEAVNKAARAYTGGKFTVHLEGGYGPGLTASNLAIVSGMRGRPINFSAEEKRMVPGSDEKKRYIDVSRSAYGTENVEEKLGRVLDRLGDTFD